MKLPGKANYSIFPVLLAVGLAALITTSCSQFASKPEPLTEAEACDRVKLLIADHPNKFNKHKKNKRVSSTLYSVGPGMTTWTATQPFPSARNCQIWEWGSGLTNYICDWRSDDGKQGAEAGYLEGKQILESCLGNEWTAKTNQTTSGGMHTYFSLPGSKTFVSIRYFKEQRSIREKWHTVLYIGDKSNLPAQTQ